MSPPLTTKASGTPGASSQRPSGRLISSPCTLLGGKSVMNPESVCATRLLIEESAPSIAG
jgi:hypothetical protein